MKYAEYSQQLSHLKMSLEDIFKALEKAPIKRWAFCLHDKDQYEDGSLKEMHIHIMMEFRSNQEPEFIAKWFNEEPQYIEKNHHKRFAFENMCSYLVHETPTADGKYHYPDEEVKANFDFHAYMEQIRTGVQKAEKKKHPIQDVLELICADKIPRLKIGQHLTDMDRIRYRKDIERAYKIRDERLMTMTDRNMKVIYLYGLSGTGKTTFRKMLGKQKGYDVFISGSSNDPLEGYQGQECIILDDVRGSDWKINDLLKLLDNHTNSLVKSRYSNKMMTECKMIILTSVMDIDELYSNLQNNDNEPIIQLQRRCPVKMQFTPSTCITYQWNQEMGRYDEVTKTLNPVPMMRYVMDNKDVLDDIQSLVNNIKEESEMPF